MTTPELRRTLRYIATPAKRKGHVTIRSRIPRAQARQRTVRPETWQELSTYPDHTFDSACCLELGIGVFVTRKAIR